MLIDVSRALPIPLTAQVASSLRSAISSGVLRPGDEVPSTRVLAGQAGVSRGTIVAAYDQLVSEGYLTATQGAPTRVNPSLPAVGSRHASPSARCGDYSSVDAAGNAVGDLAETESGHRAPRPTGRAASPISLKPSSGHAGAIRPAAWRQAWREAAADPATVTESTGQVELRNALADHLRTGRGMGVDKENIVVSGGTREGLMLVLMAIGGGKPLRIGVEDPGHPSLRKIIPLAGHTVVPCRIDDAGIAVRDLPHVLPHALPEALPDTRPDALPDNLDAVIVTPSFQYPLGASMPAARRRELLDWAARTGTVVIEDDFNAELRYRTAPLPPLAALETAAHVVTLGTFSTQLNRSVAAGYVATTSPLAHDLRRTRAMLGMPVSAVTQLAIAHLLRNGHVRRNTKAVHNRLARRRDVIAARIIPQLAVHGASVTEMAESNGVDLAVTFPDSPARDDFARDLRQRGIEAGRLDALWSGRDDGLILSFAHLSEPDFERVCRELEAMSHPAHP